MVFILSWISYGTNTIRDLPLSSIYTPSPSFTFEVGGWFFTNIKHIYIYISVTVKLTIFFLLKTTPLSILSIAGRASPPSSRTCSWVRTAPERKWCGGSQLQQSGSHFQEIRKKKIIKKRKEKYHFNISHEICWEWSRLNLTTGCMISPRAHPKYHV